MKSKTKVTITILSIILVLAVTFGILWKVGVFQGTGLDSAELIGMPSYGWISCEPSSQPTQVQTAKEIVGNPSIAPTSFNQGDISDYTLTILTPAVNSGTCLQFACPKYRGIYSICNTDGSGCSPKDQPVSACNPTSSGFTYSTVCNSNSVTIQPATNKQYVSVSWQSTKCNSASTYFSCKHDTADGWTFESGASYTAVYRPYSLYRTDFLNGGRNPVPNSATCANPIDQANQFDGELVISSTLKDLTRIQSPTLNRLQPQMTWNYVSQIVPVFAQVETWNGQQAVCQNKVMYGLSSLSTTNGDYRVIDQSKNLGSVACCNQGDSLTGYVCQNHKYVALTSTTDIQCSVATPCPLAGVTNADTSDATGKTTITQKCISNKCELVKTTVECTDSSQCPEGNRCEGGTFKCVQTSVQGGGFIEEKCGDNICGIDETLSSCPQDCTSGVGSCSAIRQSEIDQASTLEKPFVKFTSWFGYAWCQILGFFNSLANVFISGLAFIVALITIFTFPNGKIGKMIKNKKARWIVGIIIAIILGLLIFAFKWFIIITLLIIAIIWGIIKFAI